MRDIVRTLRPALLVVENLVVENEENSSLFYIGSPETYAEQLRAACRAAHQEGVPCTNGGLVSSLVALLVWVFDHREDDIFWCTADCGLAGGRPKRKTSPDGPWRTSSAPGSIPRRRRRSLRKERSTSRRTVLPVPAS